MASSSAERNTNSSEPVFDAAKQARPPSHLLARPPADLPAVRLGLVSKSVGYGLFAARDFAAGEFIFHEAPLIIARYNERFSADADLMGGQAAACRAVLFPRTPSTAAGSRSSSPAPGSSAVAAGGAHPSGPTAVAEAMAIAFPALAARLGVAPPDDWEGVVQRVLNPAGSDNATGTAGLGMNLVPGQGQYAGSMLTREEYEAYVAPLRESVAARAAAAAAAGATSSHAGGGKGERGRGGAGGGGGGGGGGKGDESSGAAAAAVAATTCGARSTTPTTPSFTTSATTIPAPVPVPEREAREACRDFFRHYAFQVPRTAGNRVPRTRSSGSSSSNNINNDDGDDDSDTTTTTGTLGSSGLSSAISITGSSIPTPTATSSPSPSINGVGGTSKTTMTGEACIYLLASLINHCCTPEHQPSTHHHHLLPGQQLHWHLHQSLFHHHHHHSHSHSNSHHSSSSPSSANQEPTTNTNTNNKPEKEHKKHHHHHHHHHPKPPPGPNCTWRIGPSGLAHFVKPRHICVQAKRAIRAGEQLTWDYGKREKGFACECETCRREGLIAGLGSVCGVI
ncbi:hypothetical protein VTJ04DRAFT_2879 [Mycothermus thermophilus]|uniref:uncharacterized protein n=1 Tax=Humicola insolens TaxID=85995 RepID=UPI0037440A41